MEQGETRVISAKSSEAKRAFMPPHLNCNGFPDLPPSPCPPTHSGSVKGTRLTALLARCCALCIPDELHTSL